MAGGGCGPLRSHLLTALHCLSPGHGKPPNRQTTRPRRSPAACLRQGPPLDPSTTQPRVLHSTAHRAWGGRAVSQRDSQPTNTCGDSVGRYKFRNCNFPENKLGTPLKIATASCVHPKGNDQVSLVSLTTFVPVVELVRGQQHKQRCASRVAGTSGVPDWAREASHLVRRGPRVGLGWASRSTFRLRARAAIPRPSPPGGAKAKWFGLSSAQNCRSVHDRVVHRVETARISLSKTHAKIPPRAPWAQNGARPGYRAILHGEFALGALPLLTLRSLLGYSRHEEESHFSGS